MFNRHEAAKVAQNHLFQFCRKMSDITMYRGLTLDKFRVLFYKTYILLRWQVNWLSKNRLRNVYTPCGLVGGALLGEEEVDKERRGHLQEQ